MSNCSGEVVVALNSMRRERCRKAVGWFRWTVSDAMQMLASMGARSRAGMTGSNQHLLSRSGVGTSGPWRWVSAERGMQCAANGMCGVLADGAGCWPWQWPCVVDARSRKLVKRGATSEKVSAQAGLCRDDAETKGRAPNHRHG